MKSIHSNPVRFAPQTLAAFLILAFCLLLVPTEAAASCLELRWRYLSPTPNATARLGHAMAYDSARNVTILFGGLDTNTAVLGDTWRFDNYGWTQLQPAHSPPARYRHTMSYDASRGVIVLFAGRDLGANMSDVWEWNGTDWTPVTVNGNAPPARHWHGMAYDAPRGVHVMFGGYVTGSQELGDTWEYNGNARTWTLRTSSGPSARRGHGLAYHAAGNQMLLFGGYNSSGLSLFARHLGDTWIWDGQNGLWTQRFPVNNPGGHAYFSLAYDSVRSVVLMQNGQVAHDEARTATTSDAWEWNGVDWTDKSSEYDFYAPRREAAMVYQLSHRRMILFAGDGADPDSTWALEPFWMGQSFVGVDWHPGAGQFGYYPTVRLGVGAAQACAEVRIRQGDYNETFLGLVPLVITKPMRLDSYWLSGDSSRTARIH
jgi:hypothetical protein